nr:MAG TPA: hypothetical protein [Caudoviricetes sp.]
MVVSLSLRLKLVMDATFSALERRGARSPLTTQERPYPTELTYFTNSEGFTAVFPASWCGTKLKKPNQGINLRINLTLILMSKEVSLVNQQEKMARAKAFTYERLKTALEDFEQVDEYSFASLENIEGEDWWTVVSIVAKKNYDIDNALEEFEIKKETKRKRQEEKEKKEKKKTSKS